ncbi:MAG: hypothetical protein LBT48_07165 [Prevotellaceae bacterium]|jgi:hypothetical protein|nr:hypothetical protein [Prevotellaceae bacterium]
MVKESKNSKQRVNDGLKQVKTVVSGNVLFRLLMNNRWYVLLLFVLGVWYISQRYFVEQSVRNLSALQKELNSVSVEYTSRSTEFMRMSKRSAIERELNRRGMTLQAPQHPPKRIKKD